MEIGFVFCWFEFRSHGMRNRQDPLLKDGDPTANIDIRDVEFRLQNDASQIRSLARSP